MRFVLNAIFSLSFATAALANPTSSSTSVERIIDVMKYDRTEVVQLENSPYAVIVFPESAQGTYIAITYWKPLTNPVEGAWKIEERVWQAEAWSSNVISLAWFSDHDTLIVATSSVYGHGGVYKLNLRQRVSEILPTQDKCGANSNNVFEILLDPDNRTIVRCERNDSNISKSFLLEEIIKTKTK